jgi:hypothetical protein
VPYFIKQNISCLHIKPEKQTTFCHHSNPQIDSSTVPIKAYSPQREKSKLKKKTAKALSGIDLNTSRENFCFFYQRNNWQ